ncbi:hypothetical protein [Natronorubrum daqingense]|uniref:Uncharacterized protein n=1 Tax=Natronorubrum daqingense TaxID=588898 RepID=A0A1N7G175_9EURY|nr:hypothetical protein [Natronorubrum daqingense]APX98623.1 hypothetical protein BB347_18190 [Natronorubrum daqingense]SIS06308.1 hypothetical protein SAMN05421809_3654 [Natronorubrum daqingense]
MVRKPPLPDGYELPEAVNGWLFDSEDTSNGHVWRSSDYECSVGVFDNLGSVSVRVTDDRVSGFASNVDPERVEYDRADRDDALSGALDAARAWMEQTDPAAWSHPDVCEAVFDAPAGYSLETYYLENRETIVYYRRDDAEMGIEIDVRGKGPEALTRETAPYLYVHQWNGSGNATVALAPWTEAHGPKTKHPDIKPILETPDECGLEVALTMARQFVREHFADSGEIDAAGQSDIGRWSA